jgi:hypothetical protein
MAECILQVLLPLGDKNVEIKGIGRKYKRKNRRR